MTAVRLKINKIVMKSKVKMCLFSVLRNRHISQPSYSASPRLSNCSILSPNLSPRLAFQQTQYRTDGKKPRYRKYRPSSHAFHPQHRPLSHSGVARFISPQKRRERERKNLIWKWKHKRKISINMFWKKT